MKSFHPGVHVNEILCSFEYIFTWIMMQLCPLTTEAGHIIVIHSWTEVIYVPIYLFIHEFVLNHVLFLSAMALIKTFV